MGYHTGNRSAVGTTRAPSYPHRDFYDTPGVVKIHKDDTELSPAEAAILSSVQCELKGRAILDIGIGAGRTTPYLRAISRNYIGMDLSEKMIESARETIGDARLLVCDARNMSVFGNEQFDAVFFLGAGIDDVNAADRMVILNEVNRVLRKNGIFVLSAHNLDARDAGLWSFNGFSVSPKPRIFIRDNINRLWSYIFCVIKHLLNKIHSKGYVIFLDYEDHYGQHQDRPGVLLSTYYINKNTQIQQLLDAGFYQAAALDKFGLVADTDRIRKDGFVYCMARKK